MYLHFNTRNKSTQHTEKEIHTFDFIFWHNNWLYYDQTK